MHPVLQNECNVMIYTPQRGSPVRKESVSTQRGSAALRPTLNLIYMMMYVITLPLEYVLLLIGIASS